MSIAIATRGLVAGIGTGIGTDTVCDGIDRVDLEVVIDVKYDEAMPISSGPEYLPNKRNIEEIHPIKKAYKFPLPRHL